MEGLRKCACALFLVLQFIVVCYNKIKCYFKRAKIESIKKAREIYLLSIK